MTGKLVYGEVDSGYEVWEFDTEEKADAFYAANSDKYDSASGPRRMHGIWEVELGFDPQEADYEPDPDREFRKQVLNEVMTSHPDMAFTGEQVSDYLETGDMHEPYIESMNFDPNY